MSDTKIVVINDKGDEHHVATITITWEKQHDYVVYDWMIDKVVADAALNLVELILIINKEQKLH